LEWRSGNYLEVLFRFSEFLVLVNESSMEIRSIIILFRKKYSFINTDHFVLKAKRIVRNRITFDVSWKTRIA